ncbi:hypothetical protein HanPI659440_Chr17g0700651 [Helianthus annuus]|nr:hypothetical protein HanPI659440_Chr17g0700651 [Helianthus annuus]
MMTRYSFKFFIIVEHCDKQPLLHRLLPTSHQIIRFSSLMKSLWLQFRRMGRERDSAADGDCLNGSAASAVLYRLTSQSSVV